MVRNVDTRPTGPEWVNIDVGHVLWMDFHPNRVQEGRNDDIRRPSIVYGERGHEEQLGRIDAFSVGGHYHVLPTRGDKPIRLRRKKGQSFFDSGLDILRNPNRFRNLLKRAGLQDLTGAISTEDLLAAAKQIEHLYRH